MSTYYLAEYKLEEAIASLLKTAVSSLGIDVLTGVDEATIDYDCVLVAATDAEPIQELQPMLGNWNVTLSIKVISNCADGNTSKDSHMARINAVRGVLMDSAFETSIDTAAGETIVFGQAMMKGRTSSVNNRCWIQETQIVVPCIDGA